jgi:hypothetical protein
MTGHRRALLALMLAFSAVAASCGGGSTRSAGTLGLRTVADLRLPGDTSRFDYPSLDPNRHLLFIAHLGAGEVIEVDTDRRQVVRVIPGLAGVHGVLVLPELGRVFATATDSGEVVTLDEGSGVVLARAPDAHTPDGLAYDPVHGRVFVSDEQGGETVIDARTGGRVGAIDIGGEAGNTAYDPGRGEVLVDVQTRNDVAVIDPASLRVTGRIPLHGCDHDHSLLVDRPARAAFVACDGNGRLLALNLDTRQVLRSFDTGDGPDVLAFDRSLGRLYVAAESGTMTVLTKQGDGPVQLVGRRLLAQGRTLSRG